MSQNYQRKIGRTKKSKAERNARRLFWDALGSMEVLEQTFYATLNNLPLWRRCVMAGRLLFKCMTPILPPKVVEEPEAKKEQTEKVGA